MDINSPISHYVKAVKEVYDYFGCEYNFFIKPMFSVKWNISSDDGIFFLKYGENQNQTSVIVKDDGNPIIVRANDFTLVVGIDCVKIAFVLENAYEI